MSSILFTAIVFFKVIVYFDFSIKNSVANGHAVSSLDISRISRF